MSNDKFLSIILKTTDPKVGITFVKTLSCTEAFLSKIIPTKKKRIFFEEVRLIMRKIFYLNPTNTRIHFIHLNIFCWRKVKFPAFPD